VIVDELLIVIEVKVLENIRIVGILIGEDTIH
jgi:hypothetical protein